MSDGQYYIRVRGRVQGPFNTDQLHSMAKRGQFSRLHEVSSDGNTWARASESPDLFPICTVAVTVSARAAASAAADEIPVAPSAAPPAPRGGMTASGPPQVDWYYSHKGIQSGPHDFDTLKMLVSAGQIGADDLAWCAGMASWQPVQQISGLKAGSPAAPPDFAAPLQPARASAGDEPRTAGMAIAAVVLGILAAALATGSVVLALFVSPAVSIGAWLTAMFVSVLTAIFGHSARKQIRRAPARITGSGLAVTGLVMAYLVLAVAAFVILVFLALFIIALVGARAAMSS